MAEEPNKNETPDASVQPKKPFVEPEISMPLEVLEATRWYLQVTGVADASDAADIP
jgi:hypothetical protein